MLHSTLTIALSRALNYELFFLSFFFALSPTSDLDIYFILNPEP